MPIPSFMPIPADGRAPERFGGLLRRLGRTAWLVLGLVCVGLGIIGAILPLMPTTIFLILAAGCFARSSPRLERWLLEHKRFGPTLVAWREQGAIGRRAKAMACTGIAVGFALFLWRAHPGPLLGIGVAAVMAACALYILTRPPPSRFLPSRSLAPHAARRTPVD